MSTERDGSSTVICGRCGGSGYTWDGVSFSEDAGGKLYDPCGECHGTGDENMHRCTVCGEKDKGYRDWGMDHARRCGGDVRRPARWGDYA